MHRWVRINQAEGVGALRLLGPGSAGFDLERSGPPPIDDPRSIVFWSGRIL
jgi:hypothetical protein